MSSYAYGETALVCEAQKGSFTAQLYSDPDGLLLLRLAPGVKLSDSQFDLWFPDLERPRLEVDTAGVTLYKWGHPDEFDLHADETRVKKYFKEQLPKLVSFLDGLEAGTYLS